MRALLLIIVVLMLIGVLPIWPHSIHWGYFPSGGLGTVLDIPLGHKDAAFVRSHFDGMEVQINDAPRANEIMVALAVTDSGRPLPRVGGLTVAEIKGEDGLR